MKNRFFKNFLIFTLCFLATPHLFAEVSPSRQKLIDNALTFRGIPYKYAGKIPETGFDCSGFVSYVANDALNIKLSPSTTQMFREVKKISISEREPGDLIFFAVKGSDGISRVNHVAIYLGKYTGSGALNGKRLMVHAASDGPSTGVIVSDVEENYWKNHFYSYARILPSTKDTKTQAEK